MLHVNCVDAPNSFAELESWPISVSLAPRTASRPERDLANSAPLFVAVANKEPSPAIAPTPAPTAIALKDVPKLLI